MTTLRYRPDIEGLRALAVLLVIVYHFEFPGISGGFIGVDVFFVISGFVITGLLTRKIERGEFRFGDFYARRIRRLVPAFLLVSTVTFLVISPFYIGDDYYIFAKSWLASLIGLSNLYYFTELSQYFAPETRSLSLLHTWSLAVEEQFYLLWPAAALWAWRSGRLTRSPGVFLVLLVAALLLSVYLAHVHPKAAFYLPPARLFEFMLGAGVALYGRRLPALGPRSAELLALVGLAMILATAALLTSRDPFPGLNALWPTLGTAMVIQAGVMQPNTFTARLLALRGMVFLGGLSYSLYLWHWPPVALLHYQLIELTWPIRLGLLAAVLLVSWLGYVLVENRLRHRPWSFKRSFTILVFIPLLMIWAIQSTIRIADDLSFRIPEERRDLYRIIVQNDSADVHEPCFKGPPREFVRGPACLFGAPVTGERPDSVLIGDSHAIALIGFMEELLKGTDLSLLLVTQASTPFLPGKLASQVFPEDGEKAVRNRALTDYLSQEPMTVFISAWWSAYLRDPAFQGHFKDTIKWLIDQGHQVVVLEGIPGLPSAAHAQCLLKGLKDCSIDARDAAKERRNFERFQRAVEQRYPSVKWIDPSRVLCDQRRCRTVLNGIPLYRDESHLNYIGAQEIGQAYRARFGNPLSPITAADVDSGTPTP
ncbi:MAG TPA: acyltransferase family protein [Alcanivorax sp.]|nr:acyltransferase family protein [Alcanivorax sp.]